ncbi:MAG TPA: GAF domain-containing protein, partial [Acetobacteraceae bacterium]|nr:GAF domain-containing protein [Acetobacteraceae bacterium]
MAGEKPGSWRGGEAERGDALPVSARPQILRRAEASDTIEAWERFLTGGPRAVMPRGNFVVSSWMRSRDYGIDPNGRAAPFAASGGQIDELREGNRVLLSAAHDIFECTSDLLIGARSIMVLTDMNGIVLQVAGDHRTRDEGESIHLALGGHWHEDRIGTNGIGTAIATGGPAQVHAAEHFCEGIKSWTCAACPIFESGTGKIL